MSGEQEAAADRPAADSPAADSPPRPQLCPGCGAELPSRARFCPSCGRQLELPQGNTAAPAESPEAAEESVAPPLDTRYIQEELPARYRATRLLGRGGMGVVFHCHDSALDRAVAIKLMSNRYGEDPRAERRFLREARAQAIINHPNVVQVLNAGVSTHGRPYIVMEYIEGRSLQQVIAEHPYGLDLARACDLVLQCCAGLGEAHAGGVIHRDLKPSNLMIAVDRRGREHLKILDLGLAKIIGGAADLKTLSGDSQDMLVGTPAFMSPEQVSGAEVDARADLYALGVVFFGMLTGRLPFESTTLEGWLMQHLTAVPPPPSQFRKDLAAYPDIDRLVLWMLAKAPQDRPQSADLLAAALQGTYGAFATLPGANGVELATVGLAVALPSTEPLTRTAVVEGVSRQRQTEALLENAQQAAQAGDWAAVEGALAGAAALGTNELQVEQVRARTQRVLIRTWLDRASERLGFFTDPLQRQDVAAKVAAGRAQMGDWPGAITEMQREFPDAEPRIRCLSKAALAGIQSGYREGLRPYLERGLDAATELSDAGARERACLAIGRAFSAYGDQEAARQAYQHVLAAFPPRAPRGETGQMDRQHASGISSIRERPASLTRRLLVALPPGKEGTLEYRLASLAQAQTQAGWFEDALVTVRRIEDAWTKAQVLAQMCQLLAQSGRLEQAEEIAPHIVFKLPRDAALREIAVARARRNDWEIAEQRLTELTNEEERAPAEAGLGAVHYRQRAGALAEACAQRAQAAALEAPSRQGRFLALLRSAEPFLQAGALNLALPLLQAASRMVYSLTDPEDRLLELLRLTRTWTLAPALERGPASVTTPGIPLESEAVDCLRRALGTLSLVPNTSNREECLESLAYALAEAGAHDLTPEFLAQARSEKERALIYVSLAAGLA